jgi:RNA polymerase sigma-70 factor (ECF subfamily)
MMARAERPADRKGKRPWDGAGAAAQTGTDTAATITAMDRSVKASINGAAGAKSSTDGVGDLAPAALGRASDEELMRRTQAGDRQGFALLYERYSAAVLSYLYRMLGNVEDVEAIGQEVFLRAFRFAGTYRYPQKVSTWLFAITRNLAINQSRRRKRSPVRNMTELNLEGVELSGDPRQVARTASDDPEKQEEIARVLTALEDLPTDQKEVIVLGIFQELSYAQIEQITGTKAVTLRSRMFHGLKRLARALGAGQGSDSG